MCDVILQCCSTINLRFTFTKQIEVWPVDQQNRTHLGDLTALDSSDYDGLATQEDKNSSSALRTVSESMSSTTSKP